MNKRVEELSESLAAIRESFDDFEKAFEAESEKTWNSLTKDQQLDIFCAVCRKLYKGEIQDKGSYRYVLYDVFGFGPEAYVCAQISGFLAIHNAIMDKGYDRRLLKLFCEFSGIEDYESKIDKYVG